MSVPSEHDYIGGLTTRISSTQETLVSSSSTLSLKQDNNHEQKTTMIDDDLNLKETELRLGLPGSFSPERKPTNGSCLKTLVSGSKRGFSDASVLPQQHKNELSAATETKTASKAQVVGWPPIRSFRKNSMASSNSAKNEADAAETKAGLGCLYVKVSMEGAPYLRKVDLKNYLNYAQLSAALEKMFSFFTIGQCGSNGRDRLKESRVVDLLHSSDYVLTYEDKDGDWMLVGDVPWEMFTDSCRKLKIMIGSEAIGLAPMAMEKGKSKN